MSLLSGDPWYARGESEMAADLVMADPRRLEELIDCLAEGDAGQANRAGHAMVAIQTRLAGQILEYRHALLDLMEQSPHWFVRYRIGRVVSFLLAKGRWPKAEIPLVFSVYERMLSNSQNAVRVEAIEGVARCAAADPELLETGLWLVEKALIRATPAMMSRGRKMLALLRRTADAQLDR